MMTLRILIALALLIAGMVIVSTSFWVLADNDTFQAVMSLLVPVAGIVLGVSVLAGGLVILAHETRITDWLKERMQ
jgi:hypothetical protein